MDVPTFYRINDPIQNFRVRVEVKCLVESKRKEEKKEEIEEESEEESEEEQDEEEGNESDDSQDSAKREEKLKLKKRKEEERKKRKSKKKGLPPNRNGQVPKSQQDWAESFTWQEKKFGPRELVKYLDEDASDVGLGRTAIEAEYKDQIKRRCRFGEDLLHDISSVMLFTYTDKDGFVPKNELSKFVTTSEEFDLNEVAESIVTIPETGGRIGVGNRQNENGFEEGNGSTYGPGDGDIESISKKKKRDQNSISAGERIFRESPYKVYYIMAAVDVETGLLKSIRKEKFQKKLKTAAGGEDDEEEEVPFFARHRDEGKRKFYEVVLCTIKANREGNLVEMKPGFSKSRYLSSSHQMQTHPSADSSTWYRFKTPQGSIYEYKLVNEAESADPLLETEINTLQRENTERTISALEGRVSNILQLGPTSPRQVLYHVFMEIVSASGFVDAASDDLYIQYEVVLPANKKWSWVSTSHPNHVCTGSDLDSNYPLRGVTQTARCRYVLKPTHRTFAQRFSCDSRLSDEAPAEESHQFVAHYCFPLELQMSYSPSGLDWDGLPLSSHEMPTVYFEVKSRDRWERHRAEGYGNISLPSEGCCSDSSIQTWRVAGSVRQQSSEYFVGGALQLDSPSYTFLPPAQRGPFLNRYGFRSENAGSLRVRMNTIAHTYVEPAITSELDKNERELRKNGMSDSFEAFSKQKSQIASQTKRRTVSDILNSLRFGRKIGKSAEKINVDSSSDLLASLNRLKVQKTTSIKEIESDKKNSDDSDDDREE